MVSVLSRKIARPIINEGKSGETSAQGLARINSILAHDPDMVILLFGGNDVLQRVPLETTFENLRSIILTLQAHDITVVLLGVQGGALTDPFRKPFDELAKTYNLIYIPNVLHKVFTKEELMSDAVHPNDAGYAIIANRVFEAIQHLFN
jgi:lysophospholipase L1-like esterase